MSSSAVRRAATEPGSGADRRNTRWYLAGLGASVLGDSAMTLAAGIWVKSLTGSNTAAGLVSVGIYAPTLLAPLGGLLADRARRRPLLIGANLVMAAVVGTLLAVRSADEAWLIFVVMVAYGAANVVIDPAESALFAIMLPTDLRQRINGLRLTLTEGGKLTAPLLGAGLFALLGGGPVAALDAVTFVVAGFATSRLRVTEPRPVRRRSVPTPWHAEVMAGLSRVRGSVELRTIVSAGTAAMAISGLTAGAQYGLVDALNEPPAFLGALTAALGAGSIAAGLTSSRMITRFGESRLAVIGLLDGTVGSLLVGTGWLPTAVAGFAVLGFALPWTVLALINLTQRLTPDPLQGRVAAMVTLALFGPLPVTQAIGSAIIGPLGYRTAYLLVGALFLLTAGGLLRQQPGTSKVDIPREEGGAVPRIVGGVAGGRRIAAPTGAATRPTTDRVREALFSALGDLTGLRVLDGYAGSGALGLEALSRGAAQVLLVERAPAALRVLRANVAALGLPGAAVHAGPLGPLLARPPAESYDLVLLDPPYAQDVDRDLAALTAGGWLSPGADVVIERATRGADPTVPSPLTLRNTRAYGETTLWYLRAP